MSAIEKENVEDVIIPVAGEGKRMKRLTRVVPKNLLPLGYETLIDYAVNEALSVRSVQRVHIICSPKHLEMYIAQFSDIPEIQQKLNFIVQEKPLGLGHAVLQAREFVTGSVAVILPDDYVAPVQGVEQDVLKQMCVSYTGGMSVAAMRVPNEYIHRYGAFKLEKIFDESASMHQAIGIVEKPKENAPSNLAAIGRYILPRKIFNALVHTKAGAGGEIQLTDAIEETRQSGTPLYAVTFEGTRYDCGNPEGYMRAQVAVARRLGVH